MRENKVPLVTTDYVIDETLTLLRARGERQRALAIGEEFFKGRLARVYYLTEGDILRAWQTFRQYADRDWSFTDCTSKVVMESLKITHALTFDHHFGQFGGVVPVP